MSLITSVKRDIKAVLERDPAASNAVGVVFTYPGFQARQFHRVAHTLYRRHIRGLPMMVAYATRFLTGIEIHPGAKIGEGLFIDHGMGVVIGETAEIGDNVTLHQGVTLGGTSTQKVKRHPTLKDSVMIGLALNLSGTLPSGRTVRWAPARWC